jgi:hypothetical protein
METIRKLERTKNRSRDKIPPGTIEGPPGTFSGLA